MNRRAVNDRLRDTSPGSPTRLFLPFALLLALVLRPASAFADQYTFLGSYVSHRVIGDTVSITATNNVLRLTVLGESTVRIQVGSGGRILDIPSYTAIPQPAGSRRLRIEESTSSLSIPMANGRVEISKHPLRLRFLDAEGNELLADDPSFGHGWDGKEVQAWKRLHPDERFYGLGEKTGPLDRRGQSWTMWNSDIPGYSDDRDPLYMSVPFFIGLHGGRAYGVFLDNTFRTVFNMGAGSDRLFSFGAEDGEMNYYVFLGLSIADVISRYTELTGRMPLPPLWALGYQQCRWSYYPEFEVRDLAKNFRQRSIPCDVIYLDIRYMDRYKVFTWDPAAFPDPKRLLADLRAEGFSVVPIIDPGIKAEPGYHAYDEGVRDSLFARYADGELYKGQVWPGWCAFPDFTLQRTRDWWGAHYGAMMKEGIAGFWNDMNEPAVWGREMPTTVQFGETGTAATIKKVHNVYGYLMAQASYEGIRKHAPGKRPFIVSRAGYAGQQKYSANWTGDNVARFDNLAMAVRMCLGMGLSGLPFTGADVGGFIDSPTPELYARWIEAGVFTPFFRTHTAINTRDQEPWSFGEETEDIVRENISLRYQLLPYIYTAFREASESGLPIMQPLFLRHQSDPRTYDWAYQQEYYFGSDILVAPVLQEGQRYQKVYLPEGTWIDPVSGRAYDGRREVLVEAPLSRIPYFYRAGACIPRRETIQHTGEKPLTHLFVDVAAGAAGTSKLYLDAGDGFEYMKGEFDEIAFSLSSSRDELQLSTASTDHRWARAIRTVTYRVFNVPSEPKEVRDGATALHKTDAPAPGTGEYRYDAERKRCIVTTTFDTGERRISIR